MSGYLNIRNDRSDHNAVTLTFDGKGKGENGSTERLGGTLKIDIGRTATIKLPDFLQTDSEIQTKTDTEPVDQKLERQAARIKQLEAAQHNHLVPADETDNARMQELIKALTVANEERHALGHVLQHMETEFDAMLNRADEDAISNLNRTYQIEDGGTDSASRHFKNATVKTKADMFGALQASVDEDETRKVSKAAHARSSSAQLDKDAKYFGDTFRGADSTTDLSDQAVTRNDDFEESEGDEQNAAESRNHLQESRSGRPGGMQSTAGNTEDADPSPTGHQPSDNSFDSHVETQEKADELLEDENTHLGTEAEGSADDQSDVESTEEGDGEFEKEETWHAPQLGSDATTERSDLDDRPVKMDDENDEGAASEMDKTEASDEGGVANENRPEEKAKDAAEAAEVASEAAQETSEKAQESQDAADNKASQEDDDNFRSRVNKLKSSQLDMVESGYEDLDGNGKVNDRKNALKDKYDNASDEDRQQLSDDVDAALEG